MNNGNEDKEDLVYPGKYGLDNTVNVYFQSLDTRASQDRIGGWIIKYYRLIYSLLSHSFIYILGQKIKQPYPRERAKSRTLAILKAVVKMEMTLDPMSLQRNTVYFCSCMEMLRHLFELC